jgi:hypothetical protein
MSNLSKMIYGLEEENPSFHPVEHHKLMAKMFAASQTAHNASSTAHSLGSGGSRTTHPAAAEAHKHAQGLAEKAGFGALALHHKDQAKAHTIFHSRG